MSKKKFLIKKTNLHIWRICLSLSINHFILENYKILYKTHISETLQWAFYKIYHLKCTISMKNLFLFTMFQIHLKNWLRHQFEPGTTLVFLKGKKKICACRTIREFSECLKFFFLSDSIVNVFWWSPCAYLAIIIHKNI